MSSTAVYVTSNDPRAEANAVLALRRPAGGTLQPLGTFPTRGRGVVNPGSQFDTEDFDQVVHIDPHRRLLFAANGGSDSIAVFAIDATGSLSHVDGSPFDAGGGNRAAPLTSSASTRPATSSTSSRPARRPVSRKTTCSTSSRSTLTGS